VKRRSALAAIGIAAASPFAVSAQQKVMPTVGYLGSTPAGPAAPFVAAFLQGLSETGYIAGKSVAIDYRWAEGHFDRLPALAADLVGRKVDLIVSGGGAAAALAAKAATSTIPIVFTIGTDPIKDGIVASLARPEGNLTGIAFLSVEMMSKRLELLCELVPQATVIALLVNPNNAIADVTVRSTQEAARVKGVQLSVLKAASQSEIDAAFASLGQLHAGALIVGPDPFFDSQREQPVTLAVRHAVPVIYHWHELAAIGGLISYGVSFPFVYRQAGIYTGRILKGARPADLPVLQPTTFELVVNLKTAKALGVTVPRSILQSATEVIE
jgi:putative ABC transport system substrate-binding protein